MTGGTITLPWVSNALSPNEKQHPMQVHKARKRAKHDAFFATKSAKVSVPADGRIPYDLHFWPPGGGRYDEDNLIARMKAPLDGIAAALGVDDSRFKIREVHLHRAQRPGRVEVRL